MIRLNIALIIIDKLISWGSLIRGSLSFPMNMVTAAAAVMVMEMVAVALLNVHVYDVQVFESIGITLFVWDHTVGGKHIV